MTPQSRTPRIRAVIFDLDGVLTDTAELHYQAWKRLAEEGDSLSPVRTTNGCAAFRGASRWSTCCRGGWSPRLRPRR